MRLMRMVAVCGLVFASLSVEAQVARIDAMGGCDVIDDISLILGYPANIVDYKDQVQATGGGALGLVFANKGISDIFTIGIIGNHPGFLRSDFYTDAVSAVQDVQVGTNPPDLPTNLPRIPHLVLGLDFDMVQLGVDIFGEFATSHFSTQASNDDDIETSARVYNVGALLHAKIDFDGFVLSPIIGAGLPDAYAKYEVIPQAGTGGTTDEVETEENLLILGGVETAFDLQDVAMTIGATYAYEKYQFIRNDETGVVTRTPEFADKNYFLDAYAGLSGTALTDLLWVIQYDFSMGWNLEKTETTGAAPIVTETKTYDRAHLLHAGLEKPVSNVWIFDQIFGRGGIAVQISDDFTVIEETGSGTNQFTEEVKTNTSNAVTSVFPTVGLGLRKGGWTFDIVSRLSNWTGVVSGPPVVEGTLTLDFGKVGRGRMQNSAPAQEQSTPMYEPPATDEYDTDDDSGFSF